jgi:uncharacterized membrane protein
VDFSGDFATRFEQDAKEQEEKRKEEVGARSFENEPFDFEISNAFPICF